MPRSRRVRSSVVSAAIAVVGLAAEARSEIVLQTFPGTATNLRFGRSVGGGGGDVDGDGHPDVIVGGTNSSVAGRVRVYSGATGAVRFDLASSDPMESFGAAVCIVGDVDGDGHADFAVGVPDWNGVPIHAGQVHIYSGADGSVLQTFTGDSQADGLGATLAPAGDVDGDGYPDLVVGAPGSRTVADYAGLVRVYSGHTGATLFTVYGDKLYDGLGMSVCGVGDVNGDGHADVLAGAWEIGSAGLAAGYARLYSGADGSILAAVHGLGYQDRFGSSVAAVGDLDGDGVGDFAVGAPDNDTHGSNSGMVRVFSGRTGGVLRTLFGPSADAEFGISLAGPGDLDGDGIPELLVGAWAESVGTATKAGTVRLLRGSDAAVFEVYHGYNAFDAFGVAVSATGDVDGDGHPDFVVGAPGDDPQGAESGSARLLSGRLSSATNYCIAAPNSAGPGATIGYTGSLSIGSNTFALTASGVPGNVFGFFFYGPNQASVPFANGYRCVAGQISRLHSGHAVNGVMTRGVDFTNLPVNGVITPASTWNFQCYYRDPSAGPFFSNLSDGLSVLFSL